MPKPQPQPCATWIRHAIRVWMQAVEESTHVPRTGLEILLFLSANAALRDAGAAGIRVHYRALDVGADPSSVPVLRRRSEPSPRALDS